MGLFSHPGSFHLLLLYVTIFFSFFFFRLFICAYIGPFLPPSPTPPSHFQAESVLSLSLILLRKEYKQ
jgi:hypothetical protein